MWNQVVVLFGSSTSTKIPMNPMTTYLLTQYDNIVTSIRDTQKIKVPSIKRMKLLIIGAGGAGLCAGRHCLVAGFEFDICEQTGSIGGTWNYTDRVGLDENGLPIHSSMYKNLRTNLPKELMQYEGFPYLKLDKSFIYQAEVLDYINNFARHYDIERHIKFFRKVTKVDPECTHWVVEIENVLDGTITKATYDAVVVCNGHFFDPIMPEIPGIEIFQGRVSHSHNYRSPEKFKSKVVLIVGAGPSGIDIAKQIASVSDKVFISHKSELFLALPPNVVAKPVVVKFGHNEAIFEDGSKCEIDEILFCTGYHYTFPFLSERCKVQVTDEHVHPLYKHVINIEHPTMAFIGLPFRVCPFPMFDIQVRFFYASLNGNFQLPTKEAMLEDLNAEIRHKSGIPKRKFHQMASENQKNYFDDLAETAGIKKVPPVICKLFHRVSKTRNLEARFEIIDDENFAEL